MGKSGRPGPGNGAFFAKLLSTDVPGPSLAVLNSSCMVGWVQSLSVPRLPKVPNALRPSLSLKTTV